MQTDDVLQWEMHGGGTRISFVARRSEGGYGLTVRRDDAVVIHDVAPDGTVLLRKSQTSARRCTTSVMRRSRRRPEPRSCWVVSAGDLRRR
jgi:hypothetical protein